MLLWVRLTIVSLLWVVAGVYLLVPASTKVRKGLCQIVVLGDIGHSPRMQYHALSIARHGGNVDLVGYHDSEPLTDLKQYENVTFRLLKRTPSILQTSNKALFVFTAPLKVLYQLWTLWTTLAYQSPTCAWMLVQNPPSIPTLLLTILVCKIKGSKLVVDWHNFGYSILALKLGKGHPLVTISRLYETLLARFVNYHLTVSDAMRAVLQHDFRIKTPILTLHDRPAPVFRPVATQDRAAELVRQPLTAGEAPEILGGKTRVVVSSTSWTPDEDFSVLLDALCKYSASAISDSPQLPELLVIITGKGPMREQYLTKIKQLEDADELEMVTIKTEWLPFEDYAILLAIADLGVSLHTSSSGVDLPMKVVDMFGAGLPVLGYNNYKAWKELVTENVNGQGFSNADDMADHLKHLFDPENITLATLKEGALRESRNRWESEWDPVAGRLFGFVT